MAMKQFSFDTVFQGDVYYPGAGMCDFVDSDTSCIQVWYGRGKESLPMG